MRIGIILNKLRDGYETKIETQRRFLLLTMQNSIIRKMILHRTFFKGRFMDHKMNLQPIR